MDEPRDRRAFLQRFAAAGMGGTLLPSLLAQPLRDGAEITAETVRCAEEIAGLSFTEEQREAMLADLRDYVESYARIREFPLPNAVPPALTFLPDPSGLAPAPPDGADRPSDARVNRPADEALVYLTVRELAELIRSRQLGSEELTRIYLDRMGRLDDRLHAVVTVTEERALAQARAADREIGNGNYRGLLHGIPWGAKDLLAVSNYPTTWGTEPYREQQFERDAEVVRRLDAAGAVLIAKLSLGELAYGDVWFGGTTRNPWNLEQGSSGSSAGPGAATAAGMVGFSIGSETLGSISSPSTRNGVTGLRPTYGRVPRTGAMALSWSMDKLGPMCRSAEDCALVFRAIVGPDDVDPARAPSGFQWDAASSPGGLRIGFVPGAFEGDEEQAALDREALGVVREMSGEMVEIELPRFPYDAMQIILNAEAAAAFDELTRTGGLERMARQGPESWPTILPASRSIPAVEYINANRIRTEAAAAWNRLFERVDLIVTPTGAEDQLTATNLTGHPALILPNGFRDDGTPGSITLLGPLYREDRLLAIGHAFQQRTGHHRRHPQL